MDRRAQLISSSPEATERLAALVAAACQPGDCLALSGDLGAGKTAFARAFIQSRGIAEEVVSPTFTILQSYGDVAHFDLYRIKSPRELDEIGFDDAVSENICLIEWPEIAAARLPKNYLMIEIRHGKNDLEREIILSSTAPKWQSLLENIGANFK